MAPKTKEQYEEIRQRSMAAIKEVALELFAHHGYHSTSISQIAKAAGVSKGLMYNYFASKQDLLESIITDVVQMGDKLMKDELQPGRDPREALRAVTERSFAIVDENPHFWKLLTSLAFQPGVLADVGKFLQNAQEENLAKSIDLFRKLGAEDPELEAFFYGAVMDGIWVGYMTLGDQYPKDRMKWYILKRFGLLSKKEDRD